MNPYQVPETKVIVAPCAPLIATGRKIPPEMWTRHAFTRTERRADPKFAELRPEYHHWYRCEITGTERVLSVMGDSTPQTVDPEELS